MAKKAMTIGALIGALTAVEDAMAPVVFDFEHTHPTTIASWRGDYSLAALGWLGYGYGPMAGERGEPERENKPPTVAGLLRELRGSLVVAHEGWKGGRYTFYEGTPLYVANPGNSGNTVIVKIKVVTGGDVVLMTRYRKEVY